MSITVADVIAVMESVFEPRLAEEWDRIGLVAGDPHTRVSRIGFAVDPCQATVAEAVARQADMLITHHPLFLRGTSTVATTTAKGSWVHTLIKNDIALYAAHTNADAAPTGSAVALGKLLQLENMRPLAPNPNQPELGIGRVGELPLTMSVRELAQRLHGLLPHTQPGVLVGGDPEKIVRTVALSPGSGDSFLAAANEAGADVYICADLRHHPATDHLWSGGCALIGLTHFASEWPVLPAMAQAITDSLDVDTYISTIVTDPWTLRI
ncbi:Nif3-like dinuclear metal center hexameric protein [Arcanobacterium pinnipediorum]|uniref:GTP cyclohydrolase 1 type 2 homolog n=1 Tax=Arcanobacterium pinnipediorum TaxID=1503041 RepID=A0ABY5AJP9_9ACTO|nr:Nif3-like dinuclear metal center hexameric protein [Arcanobacterium pinnipediorum]USR80082.1 Nif3-like dinuclear metal center hexameric protein [Arcanobacterium pinnipediorum]